MVELWEERVVGGFMGFAALDNEGKWGFYKRWEGVYVLDVCQLIQGLFGFMRIYLAH